jgi:hypothetical protein
VFSQQYGSCSANSTGDVQSTVREVFSQQYWRCSVNSTGGVQPTVLEVFSQQYGNNLYGYVTGEAAREEKINLNYIYSFSPYRAVNTLRLSYKKAVREIQGQPICTKNWSCYGHPYIFCLFRDIFATH